MYYYTKILFRVYNASMYCNDLKVSQNKHLLTNLRLQSVETDDVL